MEKRVDKLGRVRCKSYSQKKNPPKKARSALSADKPKFVESQSQVMSDDDESYYKNYEKGMDKSPNIDETIERLIEEAIFNTEDDDSDLISNEKWHELMDLPETLADDDSTKNESDYVETEKKESSKTDGFARFYYLPWSSYDNLYKHGADCTLFYVSQHQWCPAK